MLPVYKEKIALWDWYEIESTGSTNDEIKRLVPSSGSSVALSAIRQTGGRGRRGTKSGVARITVRAVAGGSGLGTGTSMGGMEIAKEFAVIARAVQTENGGWL